MRQGIKAGMLNHELFPVFCLSALNDIIDGRLQNEQAPLRDDMKTYIKLHYELKEDLMDYFLEWL